MAFENVYLTKEERENFYAKEIKNPLSPILHTLKPGYWTVDRTKEIYLFKIGTHRDYPDEELFFYKWKEYEFILPIKKENLLPNTRIWSLETSWSRPFSEIENKKLLNELIEDLKLALKEHNLDGTPNSTNATVNIVCDF